MNESISSLLISYLAGYKMKTRVSRKLTEQEAIVVETIQAVIFSSTFPSAVFSFFHSRKKCRLLGE